MKTGMGSWCHFIWIPSFFIITGERAKIWRLSKSTSQQSAYTTMIGEWCDVQKAVTIREWNKCNAFVFTIKIEWNDPIILGSSSGSLIKIYGIAHLTATVHGRASQHPKLLGNLNLQGILKNLFFYSILNFNFQRRKLK